MNPLLQLIKICETKCSQRACLDISHIDLIQQTISYINQSQPVDWMDGDFYDLPRVLKRVTPTSLFKNTAPEVIAALEPLFALLPEGLSQTKGLLQNDNYTEFVHRVLEFSSEQAIDLLHKGMAQGRHLYVKGENFSLVHQRSIVRNFGAQILTHHPALFDEFLRGFDQYHDPSAAEQFYQEMLYEAVSNAQVDMFDTLCSYMSLKEHPTKAQPLLTREELFSMLWMEKSVDMNCELYSSVQSRDLCPTESFDERVWRLVDWVEHYITAQNAQNVARGVGVLAERLCCVTEENSEAVAKIRAQEHPIFSRLWSNPLLSGHRTHVVSRFLELINSLNLPCSSGCETAWMLYEQLPQEERNVPQQHLAVLQQYPPYAKLQLSAIVEHSAPMRSTKKM